MSLDLAGILESFKSKCPSLFASSAASRPCEQQHGSHPYTALKDVLAGATQPKEQQQQQQQQQQQSKPRNAKRSTKEKDVKQPSAHPPAALLLQFIAKVTAALRQQESVRADAEKSSCVSKSSETAIFSVLEAIQILLASSSEPPGDAAPATPSPSLAPSAKTPAAPAPKDRLVAEKLAYNFLLALADLKWFQNAFELARLLLGRLLQIAPSLAARQPCEKDVLDLFIPVSLQLVHFNVLLYLRSRQAEPDKAPPLEDTTAAAASSGVSPAAPSLNHLLVADVLSVHELFLCCASAFPTATTRPFVKRLFSKLPARARMAYVLGVQIREQLAEPCTASVDAASAYYGEAVHYLQQSLELGQDDPSLVSAASLSLAETLYASGRRGASAPPKALSQTMLDAIRLFGRSATISPEHVPLHLNVVVLNLSSDRKRLYVSRLSDGLVSHRDLGGLFLDLHKEFSGILQSSRESMKMTNDPPKWLKTRQELDARMRLLLERLQDELLGDLQSLLRSAPKSGGKPKKPKTKCAAESAPADSTVLVLDKDLSFFPFESIKALSDASVYRLPSLASLERLLQTRDCSEFDSDTFYIINPDGDLSATEKRILPFCQARNWSGITSRPPTADEFAAALEAKSLLLYCGHGAGDKYIPKECISKLDCRSVVLLIGCSSARGCQSYLQAGSPAILANLWDVTDKDIDKFTIAVLDSFVGNQAPPARSSSVDLSLAVSKARGECKLKHLNGCAPVVYGIPVLMRGE